MNHSMPIASVQSDLTGFSLPQPGDYDTYRRMNAHPTLALARAMVTGPILAGAWTLTTTPAAQPHWVDLVRQNILPLRAMILPAALRSLDYGWQPFEKVWLPNAAGQLTLAKLKPLLPDLTEILTTPTGSFAGLRQKNVLLEPIRSLVISHDVEAGDLYGRSRHENVRHTWSRWTQLDDRGGQLATKAAAIIPQVHYPQGSSQDASGRTVSNFDAAMSILANLSAGRGVAIPNLYANTDDPRTDADLAGKSAWVISFLEAAGAASNLSGLTERQRYYDILMTRGWLRPERSTLEATSAGSRADADTSTDAAIRDSQSVDADITRQLNWYLVDDLLALNFGPEARGTVQLQSIPLSDDRRARFHDLFSRLLSSPATSPQATGLIDLRALLSILDIPIQSQQPA